jgi:hypothetical protein
MFFRKSSGIYTFLINEMMNNEVKEVACDKIRNESDHFKIAKKFWKDVFYEL